MKRSVFLIDDEEEENYLRFDGNLADYESRSRDYILPSYNLALLRHASHLTLYLDALSYDFFGGEKTPAVQQTNFGALCERLWCWHQDVMHRHESMTGCYAVAYFLSWACFARIFHMTVCNNATKLENYSARRVDEFAFCKRVSVAHNIVVDDRALYYYSVNELWSSVKLIFPTLYIYTYSAEMKEFFYALFFRYCDLLSMEQEEPEQVFDNPLFFSVSHSPPSQLPIGGEGMVIVTQQEEEEEEEEFFDSFKRLRIEVNGSHSIDNSFLYDGELLFFPQLFRLKLSDRLTRLHRSDKQLQLNVNGVEERLHLIDTMIDAWLALLTSVVKNTQLRTYVIDQFKRQLAQMYVFHGEAARYKRQFPDSMAEPNDVLSNLRPNEVLRLNKSLQLPLVDLVAVYTRGLKRTLQLQNSKQKLQLQSDCCLKVPSLLLYEQEVILLTSVVDALWLKYKRVTEKERLSERFLIEELITLDDLEKKIFLTRSEADVVKVPLLVKLVRVYYVMDTDEEDAPHVLYHSEVLPEAYLVWLTLCVRRALLPSTALHASISKIVANLNRILY